MRTTVTIDHDVQQLLRDAMGQTGLSFKHTLNQAIRKGLASTCPTVQQEPYVVSPQSMGLRTGIDPTQLQKLNDEIEVDAFLEITRKLSQKSHELR